IGESTATAAEVVVQTLRRGGGIGGVIVLAIEGNIATPLNCEGMYRGLIQEDAVAKTAIFEDE
ncbi:hypothetical protein F5877DRAFT_3054, partial [Lentinula edodes]